MASVHNVQGSSSVLYPCYGLCLRCSVQLFYPAGRDYPSNGRPLPELELAPEPEPIPEPIALQQSVKLTNIEKLVLTLRRDQAYELTRIGQLLELSEEMVLHLYSQAMQKSGEGKDL